MNRKLMLGLSTLGIILLVILILLLLGALPVHPYATWGYGPGGIVFVILIVVVILLAMGKL